MKFVGSAERLRSSVYYVVDVHDEEGSSGYLCGDVCEAIINNKQYGDDDLIVAFGYDGKAPDRLSAGMLYWTLGEFKDACRFNDHIVYAFNGYTGKRQRQLKHRDQAIRLYRKFTKQITSKLPDNWEITTDEIKAWIKNHKRLPACIRNQNETRTITTGNKGRKDLSARSTGSSQVG